MVLFYYVSTHILLYSHEICQIILIVSFEFVCIQSTLIINEENKYFWKTKIIIWTNIALCKLHKIQIKS